MKKFEIILNDPTIEEVLSILPFFFNPENSDISVTAFLEGDVIINATFGTGKGWETLTSDLESAIELSCLLSDPYFFSGVV